MKYLLLLLLLLWSCSHVSTKPDTPIEVKEPTKIEEPREIKTVPGGIASITSTEKIIPSTEDWDFFFDSDKEVTHHDVMFVDRKLIANISTNIHSGGTSGPYPRRIIGYTSVGSIETWRPDVSSLYQYRHSAMDGWKKEYWIDLSKWEKILPFMKKRILELKKLGANAVYFDNSDIYANTEQDINLNIIYLKKLAEYARSIGIEPGMNNALKLIELLVDDFGFFINESCNKYNECHYYLPAVGKGKPIFHIEYPDKSKPWKRADRHCKPVEGHSVKYYKSQKLETISKDC